jgi:thiamine biosynthesis lipoprotein
VRLAAGTSIDLNAIAEGYMIDRVVDLLRAEGVERAYVEVGGDLRVYDDARLRRPFRIGIRRPGGDDLVGTLELDDGALGTAGCYERFFVLEGERLCHVIDPRSGEPVRGTEGATVLAPTATAADALATAVLVLGPDWALGQWSRSDELGAVIVTRGPDGARRTYVTTAMGPRLRAETSIASP